MIITSLDNEKVKKYRKLQKKKYREEYGEFIVEGMHLVLEAFKTGLIIELILEEDEALPLDCPYVYVTKEIMEKISTMITAPTVMALCKRRESYDITGDKILLLDELQDPGNLGTIIRSAKAFGVDTIILSENSVELYNPKVLRATQGMIFHINIINTDIKTAIKIIKNMEIPVYGTSVDYGSDVRELKQKDKKRYALVMGNEGNGVRMEVSNLCDKNLYIKMKEEVESLNVAVATSILLYELNR